MKSYFLTFFMVMFSVICLAQQKNHTVQPKETVYGISKQYNISQEELKNANPFLQTRDLQIGDQLVIPGAKGQNDGQLTTKVSGPEVVYIPTEDASFIYLEIKPKQTIYTITKQYNISEEALTSLNPQLKNGLKTGDVIRIPKSNQHSNSDSSSDVPTPEGMYKVKRGDTLFSLTKAFNCTEDEIYIANPSIQKNGLKVDSFIFIPVKGKITGKIQNDFIEHQVKPGETIYSITKLYKVTLADLISNNPELKDGLRAGMKLKVPLQSGANIIKIPTKIKRIDDNEINIALMLPFQTISSNSTEGNISMNILTGTKIALDSLARQGKKINLKVFDTENKSSTIENLMATNDFSKFDAVVGPLFLTNFKSFATLMEGSGIPIVSPFSNSSELIGLENVLISSPTDEAIADRIIEEIIANNKGEEIIILTDNKHEELANYTASKLRSAIKSSVSVTKDANQLVQKSTSVNETLLDGTVIKKEEVTPLMTVLVSDNNDLGRTYVNQLNKLDAHNLLGYGIKYVSVYDIYNTKNNENIAILKNIGFTFGTNRLVNIYGANELIVLNKFLDEYCDIPNEYQQIGFDVMYDLVDRMNHKGDVLNSLTADKARLASKYKYKKVGKSYVNESVRVLRLFVDEAESPENVSQ